MKNYELICLSSTDLSEEKLSLLREKIFSFIQEGEGELLGSKTDISVRRKLASPVKNKDEAYFTTLSFHSKPEKLETLEKKLKLESQILRYMILTKPPTTFREKMAGEKPAISRRKVVGGKVELKEIEKKLEEILGE